MASGVQTTELQAGEFTFKVRQAGPQGARPVFLLHGFPETSWSWRHQMHHLAEAGFSVLAPDQRGYSPGARPTAVQAYRAVELVGDVIAMADALGWARFDVVGHDWGGAVAWQLAGRHPDRIRTLTVVSTPHPAAFASARGAGGDQAERSSYMDFFRQEGVAERRLLDDDAAGLRNMYPLTGMVGQDIEEYIEVLGEAGALTAALNWYRAMSAGDGVGLGPITCPTLYVWSNQDVALGREAAEATESCVEGAYKFVELDGVSHWVPEDAPDRLNELLLDHLRSYA
ncbi:MAG: alpha/beta fold hydrolase [Acidimicrobiales bacterium]